MTIGEKIKERRLELKLTQKQLADKVNKTQQFIQNIECSKRRKNEGLQEVFAVLGLDIVLQPKQIKNEK